MQADEVRRSGGLGWGGGAGTGRSAGRCVGADGVCGSGGRWAGRGGEEGGAWSGVVVRNALASRARSRNNRAGSLPFASPRHLHLPGCPPPQKKNHFDTYTVLRGFLCATRPAAAAGLLLWGGWGGWCPAGVHEGCLLLTPCRTAYLHVSCIFSSSCQPCPALPGVGCCWWCWCRCCRRSGGSWRAAPSRCASRRAAPVRLLCLGRGGLQPAAAAAALHAFWLRNRLAPRCMQSPVKPPKAGGLSGLLAA